MIARTGALRALGVLAMVWAAPVAAQAIGVNAGSTAAVTIAPGTKLTVPIVIDLANAGGTNIASLTTGIAWGAGRLTFDSLRVVTALGWTFTPNTTNAASGSVSFAAFSAIALPGTATLANAHFTASATPGGTRVVPSPTAAFSAAGASVLALLQPRALDVCVAAPVRWGDVNGDDAVNIIDAQQIARASVALSVANPAALAQRGDVTADGAVNIIDAQQIARFTVALSAAARINTTFFVPPAVASATVSPGTTQNIAVGGTVQVTATPLDGASADLTGCASFTWTSSNPAIATVTADGGFVTGVANGTVTITATSTTNPAATASVTVVVGTGTPVIRVTFTHAGRTARRYVAQVSGGTIPDYLAYSVTGAAMNGATMDLSVPGSGNYTVRIVALDAATASTELFLVGGQLAVTVPAATFLVTQSLTLTPAAFTMTTLPAIVPTGVTIPIGWTIVDPSGVIDGRGINLLFCGTVQSSLAALASDFGGTPNSACTVTRPTPGTLTFSTGAAPIAAQATPGTLSLVVRGGNYMRAPPDSIFVRFINPSITRGEAPLTITVAQVATVTVTPPTPVVAAGGTQQMTATAKDAGDATINGLPVTWSSATPAVATVSVSGLVTGIANGTSVITATVGGVSGNTTVTVSGGVNVGSITVAPLAALSGNQATTAVATVRDPFDNIIGAAVTWSSSNPMIARVAPDGTVQALGTGTTNITATIGAVSGFAQLTVNQVAQGYTVEVRPLTAMSAGATAAFASAAARWAQVIRGDVPGVTLTNTDVGADCNLGQSIVLNETIDDVVIYASIVPIDGAGGILGSAGPCRSRAGSLHTYVGTMRFDSADIDAMEANGTLTAVILHEMGHVLGIGTHWTPLGLLANAAPSPGVGDPTFTGVNAQWVFPFLGTGYGGAVVPVENCCGDGTRNAHWRETVLVRELMTGFVTSGGSPLNPLSPLTAASLVDLGYVVDVSQSDPQPYFLRGAAAAQGVRIEIKELPTPPPIVTDLFGRPVGGVLRPPRPPPPHAP